MSASHRLPWGAFVVGLALGIPVGVIVRRLVVGFELLGFDVVGIKVGFDVVGIDEGFDDVGFGDVGCDVVGFLVGVSVM